MLEITAIEIATVLEITIEILQLLETTVIKTLLVQTKIEQTKRTVLCPFLIVSRV